jgi:glycosyltransferase involved in cell wall biosynthesis
MKMNNTIKILWFSNTPALSSGRGRIYQESWVSALQEEIVKRENILLGMVYFSSSKMDPFIKGRTRYFPVLNRKSGVVGKLKSRLLNRVYIHEYLDDFLAIVESFQPDIIHIMGSENPFGVILGYVKAPVVISLQGILNVYIRKYFSGLARPFIPLFTRMLRGKNPDTIFNSMRKTAVAEKEILGKCKYIIGRTDFDRRCARILAPSSRYFHADEILRRAFYRKKRKAHPTGKIVLFTTTSGAWYKGFEMILDTALLLMERGVRFEWRVAGLVQRDFIVRAAMKSRDIPDLNRLNIALLGKLNAEGLFRRMEESHVYVQVSHIENSPNSLCEAMLMGMPIVASYAGGTGSLLRDGMEGILVQDGEPWVLCGSILELLENPDKARRLAGNARKRALKRHDPAFIIKRLETVYASILNVERTRIRQAAAGRLHLSDSASVNHGPLTDPLPEDGATS